MVECPAHFIRHSRNDNVPPAARPWGVSPNRFDKEEYIDFLHGATGKKRPGFSVFVAAPASD
jgi:hypothetical protein